MKRISLVLALAISLVACQKSDKTILSGKFENYNGMPIGIVGTGLEKGLKIGTDGSFADTLDIADANYYTIQGRGVYIPLYLEKGDNVHVSVDFAGMPPVAKISGKDSLASVYLQEKAKLRAEIEQGFQQAFMQQPDAFKKIIDDAQAKYNELLANTKGLKNNFIALEKKTNAYYATQLKMIYPTIHQRFTKEEVTLPQDFKDELDQIDLDIASDFDKIPAYQELVKNHFEMQLNQLENGGLKPLIEEIKNLKSSNIKAELFKIVGSALSSSQPKEDNDLLYNSVKEYVKDTAYLEQIETRYASLEKLYPGNPSPTFDFENFKGGTTSLESLKGKLVYIDMWATWCGPCIEEIPALQALEKEYHGKDIAFVSISIDQDKEKWTEYMTKNNLNGIQLYADLSTEDNFADQYDIMYIPRFILLDKEGKIINANAPRPSEESIKTLLNQHL